MNACIGSDLSGEMAKSQAFRFFSASCELSASAADLAEDEDADVATAEDLLPDPLPYIGKSEREREREREVNVIAVSIFRNGRVYRTFVDTSGKPGGGGSLLHLCSREA